MAGHGSKVNLLIRCGRQLGQSLFLLVRYISVFVSLVARSISLLMVFGRWTIALSHYTAATFDTLYKYLHWWSRRGGVSMDLHPASDAESD